jgi:hypothetical protein
MLLPFQSAAALEALSRPVGPRATAPFSGENSSEGGGAVASESLSAIAPVTTKKRKTVSGAVPELGASNSAPESHASNSAVGRRIANLDVSRLVPDAMMPRASVEPGNWSALNDVAAQSDRRKKVRKVLSTKRQ